MPVEADGAHLSLIEIEDGFKPADPSRPNMLDTCLIARFLSEGFGYLPRILENDQQWSQVPTAAATNGVIAFSLRAS